MAKGRSPSTSTSTRPISESKREIGEGRKREMKKVVGLLALLLLFLSQQRHLVDEVWGGEFIRVRGLHFVLGGSPFFANGFNAYWLMSVASDQSQRGKVSSAFQVASTHGLTVARTWAFNDGGSIALQASPGVYNEQMFQGLDFVISEARKYGIRLILSFVNNYDTFGGKQQYVNWARSQGQSISSDDEFFTNSVVKGFYKNHIKAVIARTNKFTGVTYRDDPTILAWELMNEARCPSDPSGNTIQGWITEMAGHVKSIDSNHLLEAGLEGFYGQSAPPERQFVPGITAGTDFISNNQIQGIDFATVHSYPDQWILESDEQIQLGFLNKWLDTHIQDAKNVLQKPLLLAEFGKSWKNPGFSRTRRDDLFTTVYSKVYWSARVGGPTVGGLFWQLLARGMDSYKDGYEIVLDDVSWTTSNMIAQQCRKLRYLGKLYAKLRSIHKLETAKAIRRARQVASGYKGKDTRT
uniref:mannan endo-1,4-beta-mannosidase n=1 Tax=Anthurium amnicola TaxID=1678845 RepID=A0A1D1ZI37_9ARAE